MAKDRSTNDHGPSVKDDATYDALRARGASKQKAARIANARANPRMEPSRSGGQSPAYEKWRRDDLYHRAKDLGIEDRAQMSKDELIAALRDH